MADKKKCKVSQEEKKKQKKSTPYNIRKSSIDDVRPPKEDTLQQILGNQEVMRLFNAHEIMAKVYINQTGDMYEQEADRIAEIIVSSGTNEPIEESKPVKILENGAVSSNKSISSQTERELHSLKGKGRPLAKGLRDYFEPRFGVDLGNVRIHTESNADRLARAVRARAFTHGNNIVFANNEYKPHVPGGKKLIAHELTHVMQQRKNLYHRRIQREESENDQAPSNLTFQTVKDRIFKVDNTTLKEFMDLTGFSWGKVFDAALWGPINYGRILQEKVNKLNEKLKTYGLTTDDLIWFIIKIQRLAVARAKKLVRDNLKIVNKEYERYSNNYNDLASIYTLLTKTYGSKFFEADKLRAKALKRIIDKNKLLIPLLVAKKAALPSIRLATFEPYSPEAYLLYYMNRSEEDIAKDLSLKPSSLPRYLAIYLYAHEKNPVLPNFSDNTRKMFDEDYTEFNIADNKDTEANNDIKLKEAPNYPILSDVKINFRILGATYKNDIVGFKKEILDLLQERKDAAHKTIERLTDEPEKIWELPAVVLMVMMDNKISNTDKSGKLIWDKVEDVQKEKTFRSIGLAAIGIVLGIAGFFTGGATWAGLALGVGGAIVSGIDLYLELDSYNFQWNAANATFSPLLAKYPSAWGVALALLGLVIDIVDIAVSAVKLSASAGKIIDAGNSATNIRKAASEEYWNLKRANLLREGVTESDFVNSVSKAALSDINAPKVSDEVVGKFNDLIKIVKQDESANLMKEGLLRLFAQNEDTCRKIVTAFADQPEILVRLGNHVLMDGSVSKSFTKLYDILDSDAAKVILEYFGREGATSIDNFSGAVKTFENLKTSAKGRKELQNIIKEILTDNRKCKFFQEMSQKSATWGDLIEGVPHQKPSGVGHGYTSYKKAFEMAESGQYKEIFINKGLSRKFKGINPNNRPDVWGVRHDGTIDMFEVPHPLDNPTDLIMRLQENRQYIKKLGGKPGDIKVIPREI